MWKFLRFSAQILAFIHNWLFLGGTTTSMSLFRQSNHLHASLFLSVFICQFVHLSACPSISHTPYLRNYTSSDHNFWCTCVKWWYLQVLSSFFQNFDFVGCWEIKWQKMALNYKIFCVLLRISGFFFFIFSKFWFFGFLGGGREEG